MNSPFLQDVRNKLANGLSNRLFQHLEKTIKSLVTHCLGKFNLLSRQAFDIQSQVLLKTREKIGLLAAKIDQLEETSAKS